MKNLFILIAAGMFTLFACSDDGNPPKDGEDQVPQPVENAGPDLEGERAVQATVNDTANVGKDTSQRKDSVR